MRDTLIDPKTTLRRWLTVKRAVRKALNTGDVVTAERYKRVMRDRDEFKKLYEAECKAKEDLAVVHSQLKLGSGSHPIDMSPGRADFWCSACLQQWPCSTLRRVTGKDFAPLKLTLQEEPKDD